jgi:MFS family permease
VHHPRVAAEQVVRRGHDRRDLGPWVVGRRRDLQAPGDLVEHRQQQRLSVRDVPVQRHRCGVEVVGEASHAQGLDPLAASDGHGRRHDAVAAERPAPAAPLGREVRLPDLAVGAVVTVAAALLTVTSLAWGRAVDRLGHRRVLLAGLALTLVGLLGFAVVSQLAVTGDVPPAVTFAAMLATRSVLFGAGIGAVSVAATALVASSTDEANRTCGMGQLGAAQGLSVAVGPAVGAALAFAGLLGPVWASPVLAAAALVVVALLVQGPAGRPRSADGDGAGVVAAAGEGGRSRRLRPWDPRLWPVLVAGFGGYLTLGMLLIVVGVLVQDRLELDAEATAGTTGALLVTAGIVLILSQGLLIPRLKWPPARLLRTGLPVAAVATAVFLPADRAWIFFVGIALLALGLGLAIPGYTAAPTLLVGPEEQGSVAGLVQTTTGATFVLAPILGAGLYQVSPVWPLVTGVVACAVVSVFVWLHPALRSARVTHPPADPPAPVPATSTVEREAP